MPQRKVLLIGSMPFNDERDAMTKALDRLGDLLVALPDGEIGERSDLYPNGKRAAWAMTVINKCVEDTTNWQVVKEIVRNSSGFPTDYKSLPRLKPKHSPSALFEHLEFGYNDFFKSSFEIFKELRQERKLYDLKFQVGVPTGLDITYCMMNPLTALRYADVFSRRIAYEVNEIIESAGDQVVIQVEVPGELALAYMLPGFMVSFPVMSVINLLKKFNSKAQVGVHICLGDLNNEALVHAKALSKLAQFSNKLVEKWPLERPPVYIHYPLAEAATPPSLDPAFYAPLKDIKLPQDTRFVAGFVHDKLTLEQQNQILTIVENLRGQPVDIATSCGLGRRSPQIAQALLSAMQEIAYAELNSSVKT